MFSRDCEVWKTYKMALSEAGYPNAGVACTHHRPDGDHSITMSGPNGVPDAITWMAHQVVMRGEGIPCWPCWNADLGDECADGDCHHPDEDRFPPRHMLTRAS